MDMDMDTDMDMDMDMDMERPVASNRLVGRSHCGAWVRWVRHGSVGTV